MVELKENINELVHKFIFSAESIYKASVQDIEDELYSLMKFISEEVERLSKHLRKFQKLDWDTLNIAFFGETNAGKSTLMEALIRGDGRSIGTGEKDFTKEIKSYSFGAKVKLLDMPGIEGDEKKVKNEIWKAVNKAHIIFYIFPHGKEPERNTLLKIRKYLNKNAYVYGLINIRGIFPPKVFEYLLNNNIKIVEERSKKHLKEYLGDSFRDIFIVHSLYAFFSRAKHIPDILKTSYESALKYYSLEELEKISKIKKIEEIVKRENQEKDLTIAWDNTKKILKSQEIIIGNIISLKKNLDKALKETSEMLSILQENLKKEKGLLKDNIRKIIEIETAKLENDVLKFLYEAIENEYEQNRIENHIQSLNKQFSESLKAKIEEELQDYSQKAKERIDQTAEKVRYLLKTLNKLFHKKAEGEVSYKTSEINIKMENVLKELEWKTEEILKEIGDSVLSIAGIIIAFLSNLWLGIAVLVITAIRKIWDWFFDKPDRKKTDARKKARHEVRRMTNKIKKDIFYKANREIKKVESNFYEIVKEFKRIKSRNKEVSIFLQKVIDELKFVNYKTSEAFLKYLDKNVKFGYIQTSLKEKTHLILLCDSCNSLYEKLEIIGINKENIFIFDSTQELETSLELRRDTSEFFKRGYDIFTKYYEKIELNL